MTPLSDNWEVHRQKMRNEMEMLGFEMSGKNSFAKYYNRIVLHGTYETDLHFLCKALTGKILHERKRPFLCEWRLCKNDWKHTKTARTFDLFDLVERNVIEFEYGKVDKECYRWNHVCVNIKKIPDSVNDAIRELRRYLEGEVP